ncbi:MAG: magnesium transporter [Sphingomonadaceae bacterium]|nr:magnesium transporter [Sphingomonadaceae bacterium]
MTDDAPIVDDVLDDDGRLRRSFVGRVVATLDASDAAATRALVDPLHEADIADLFELIPGDYRQDLAKALGDKLDASVIAEMNDWVREELLDDRTANEVAAVVSELDTDDAVSIIEELDEDDRREVMRALDPDDRAAIEEALSYPEESAGRLMQRDLVAVPSHWTVARLIEFVAAEPDLPTDFWEVFVVDERHHPVGTIRLSWILTAARNALVAEVMQRDQTLIPVDEDQEEVALQFQKYALISAAVVDADGRLVGVITVDDIVHIIQEEAGEDALLLSGAGDGDINEPITATIRTRMWWLFINLWTAILAAGVVAIFQDAIAKLVTLAVLMGIVNGMGGNAATQTMAVTVRALATNQLTSSNTARMIRRELLIALANGIGLGALMAVGCQLVYHDWPLTGVLFAAMIINSVNAGLSGILIPVGLEKAGVDPAITSTVFVTTMTDVIGFFSFLGLAALFHLH